MRRKLYYIHPLYMRLTTRFFSVLLISLWIFSACSQIDKFRSDGGSPVLSITKTACKGRCPEYTATFYKEGKMLFEGVNHVKIKGKHEYVIPQSLVTNLSKKAQEIKYHSYKGEYPSADKTKAATITIVTYGGKTKMIKVEEGAPEKLASFQQSIHEEVMAIIAEQPGIPVKK